VAAMVVAKLHAHGLKAVRNAAKSGAPILWALFLAILACGVATGETGFNRLSRMEIKEKAGFTRLVFVLEQPVRYSIRHLSGKRIRITLNDTHGLALKRYRAYADARISGIAAFSTRGDRLLVDLPCWRRLRQRPCSRAILHPLC